MIARVVVTLRQDGTVHAETVGIHGPACLDTVSLLEELLDATTERSAYTADFNKDPIETSTQQAEQAQVHD